MALGNVCDFVGQYRRQFTLVVGSRYDAGMYTNVTAIKGKCVHGVVINDEELEGKFSVVGLQNQTIAEILNIFINHRVANNWRLSAHLAHDGIANQNFFIHCESF